MPCLMCGAETKPRPVLTRVRNHRGPEGSTIEKRVHMRPVQLIIQAHFHAARLELKEGLPIGGLIRLEVCGSCVDGRTAGELLAVWLDKELEKPTSALNTVCRRKKKG